MKVKKWIAIASLIATSISLTPVPVKAGKVNPHPVTCYFFQGDKLEMKNTCIYEAWSWAGKPIGSTIKSTVFNLRANLFVGIFNG